MGERETHVAICRGGTEGEDMPYRDCVGCGNESKQLNVACGARVMNGDELVCAVKIERTDAEWAGLTGAKYVRDYNPLVTTRAR